MEQNAHSAHDLKQMQMLPLEAKITMTQQRIRQWYESWIRYEIHNEKTGKTRFVTSYEEPILKDYECIVSVCEGQVYVGFSGGKDSTVLKHIVDSMYSDVPSVFTNTGLEYPEVQRFVKEIKAGEYDCFNSDVEILRPEMRFDEVLKNHGYPVISKEISRIVREAKIGLAKGNGSYAYRIAKLNGTLKKPDGTKSQFNCEKWKFMLDAPFDISEQCCNVMKKKPMKTYEKKTGRRPILGTMANESKLRRQGWIKYGCNSFERQRLSSNPLSFWTEQDILEYIVKYNVPYCSVYGQIVEDGQMDGQMFMDGCHNKLKTTGAQRTGCMFCGFGVHLEKQPNRFQRMKETHPKIHDYCMRPLEEGGLGMKEVLGFIGVEVE